MRSAWQYSYDDLAVLILDPEDAARLSREKHAELHASEEPLGSPQRTRMYRDAVVLKERGRTLSALVELVQAYRLPWREIPDGFQFKLGNQKIFQWWPRTRRCALTGAGKYQALYDHPTDALHQAIKEYGPP